MRRLQLQAVKAVENGGEHEPTTSYSEDSISSIFIQVAWIEQ